MKSLNRLFTASLLSLLAFGGLGFAVSSLQAQDWVHTGTNLGADRIRIAVADFKPSGDDPQVPGMKAVFDATLYADLGNAGIFDLVSKSMAPQASPGTPQEINLQQWSALPANAAMVAFGSLSAAGGHVMVSGYVFDTRNASSPQVLGKQYNEVASEEMARTIAHRFADEIILRLGGGINGIAETKIYFISTRTGTKEVWVMDYDGQNQHAVTHLGSISISPRISPDNSRLAFASLGHDGWSIRMFSLELNRYVAFPAGTTGSPMPAAATCTSSPASRDQTSGPRSIPAPARRLPGSAGAPASRRSIPWTSTDRTSSASPTAATP
jgi:TolB protein